MTSAKITRFNYFLRLDNAAAPFVRFDIRTPSQGARIGLTPADTLELWITAGEMPTMIATMVDDRLWEAHRPRILQMLAEHYLDRPHQPPQ